MNAPHADLFARLLPEQEAKARGRFPGLGREAREDEGRRETVDHSLGHGRLPFLTEHRSSLSQPAYSLRSAITGSTRVARRAGR